MSTLTKENKIFILEALLATVQQDHPEFQEENTTGWDLIENTKIWLGEIKDEEDDFSAFGFGISDVIDMIDAWNEDEDDEVEFTTISREEAKQILERMLSKCDMSEGVSFYTLEWYIKEFIRDRDKTNS